MAKKYKTVQHNMTLKMGSAKEALAKIPHVLAVGIGLKETNGEFTDEIAYRVFVAKKKPKEDLKKHELIPEEIEGFKTDVLTPYHITNEAFVERENTKDVRPIQGGIAMGNEKDTNAYGTLGWFAKLADNTMVVLSCKHVIYDTTFAINTTVQKVGQAFYSKSCCCECGVIGLSIIGIKDATVDCAIASVNADIPTSLRITNSSTDQVLHVKGIAQAVIGNARKIGARSIFTKGQIVHIGDAAAAATDSNGTTITIHPDQLIIIPAADETYVCENGKSAFSNPGDSGSAILDDANNMVGLLWGGDATSNSIKLTFANNIDKVIAAFAANGHPITIVFSPDGLERKTVSRKKIASQTITPNTNTSLTRLQQMLPAEWSAVIGKHRPEIIRLINTSKKTAAVWQRYQGPAFTVHFMNSMNQETYVIPKEVKGTSFTTLLVKMAGVLKETGSKALKEDISEYGFAVISAAEEAASVKDFIVKLNPVTV